MAQVAKVFRINSTSNAIEIVRGEAVYSIYCSMSAINPEYYGYGTGL